MAGVRIRCDFYSKVDSTKYRVDIYDSSYSDTIITDFNCDGFELVYGNESDKITEPLKPSSLNFHLIDDGSSEFITFETDISNAQEDQFKLILYKDVSSSWVMQWAGIIMSDLVQWDNDNTPRMFEIIATDGINRAANIEFKKIESTPYTISGVTYPQNLLKIIYDCLSYNGTSQFWGAGSPYIRVNTTWNDTAQFLDNSIDTKKQVRSLECIRIDPDFLFDHEFDDRGQGWHKDEIWRWINEYGNIHQRIRSYTDPALKVRTVLREILQLFGLRLILSDGIWYITQLITHIDSVCEYANYDRDGAFINITTSVSLRDSTPIVLSEGKFSYLPAAKSARAEVLSSDLLNVRDNGYNQLFFNHATEADDLTETKSINIGTVYGGVGSGIGLFIEQTYWPILWNSRGLTSSLIHNVNLEITVAATDTSAVNWRYLMQDTFDNKGRRTQVAGQWTNNTSDKINVTLNPKRFQGETVYRLGLQETPFSEAHNVTITIVATIIGTSSDSLLFAEFELKNTTIRIYSDDNDVEKINEYVVVNDLSAANSTELDIGKLRIHDTGVASSKNTIQVDEYVGAGRWYKSIEWESGFPSTTTLVQTILKHNIAFQRKPTKKYLGSFRSNSYVARKLITYDTGHWLMMGCKFSSNTSEWDGLWVKLAHNYGTILDGTELKNYNGSKDSERPHIDGIDPPKEVLPWRPPDKRDEFFPIAKANVGVSVPSGGSPVSSITTISVPFTQIRNRDTVYVIDYITREIVEELVISSNVNATDTTINFDSKVIAETIGIGFDLSLNANELITSNEVRSANIQSLGYGNNYSYATILKCNVTDSTPTELTLDGATGSGSDNRIKIPTDSACLVEVEIVGKESGQAQTCTFSRKTLMLNNGGSTVVANTQTIGTDYKSASFNLSSVAITANDTEDAYILTFSLGGGFANANIMAYVHVTQLED